MNKTNEDHAERFFNINVDLELRIIYIGVPQSADSTTHEISFHTAAEVIKAVILLESSSNSKITVFIMSYGGNFDASMAIYDVLRMSRCEIIIKGVGVIMSGASLIMQAADPGRRLLYPNAQVMLHGGTDGYDGHFFDFQRWAEHSKKMATKMFQIYAAHCHTNDPKTKKADYWRKKMAHDWILTAQEAIDNNIADDICTSNT